MSAVDRLRDMPDWPGRMTAPVAALYMSVSVSTFLARYRSYAVKEGNNTFWAKAQLDMLLASQFGLTQAPAPAKRQERANTWDDL